MDILAAQLPSSDAGGPFEAAPPRADASPPGHAEAGRPDASPDAAWSQDAASDVLEAPDGSESFPDVIPPFPDSGTCAACESFGVPPDGGCWIGAMCTEAGTCEPILKPEGSSCTLLWEGKSLPAACNGAECNALSQCEELPAGASCVIQSGPAAGTDGCCLDSLTCGPFGSCG